MLPPALSQFRVMLAAVADEVEFARQLLEELDLLSGELDQTTVDRISDQLISRLSTPATGYCKCCLRPFAT